MFTTCLPPNIIVSSGRAKCHSPSGLFLKYRRPPLPLSTHLISPVNLAALYPLPSDVFLSPDWALPCWPLPPAVAVVGHGRVNILRASRDAVGVATVRSKFKFLTTSWSEGACGHWPVTLHHPCFVQSHGHSHTVTLIRSPPDYPPDKNATLEGLYHSAPSLSLPSESVVNHVDDLQLPHGKNLQ